MNELRREVEAFRVVQRVAERKALPIFKAALEELYEPIFKWVEVNGIEGIPVVQLLDSQIWDKYYVRLYNEVGMDIARNEYYRHMNRDRDFGQKADGISFLANIWDTIMRDYALKYSYAIRKKLNDTTERIITEALGNDYILNLDRTGRVRLFLKEMKDNIQARSTTISRTEATTMSNLAKEVGARQWIDESGQDGYKVWIGMWGNERPEHVLLNDIVIPLSQTFDMSGFSCERPGDVNLPAELRINCRCTMIILSQRAYNQYIKRGLISEGRLLQ